MKLKLHNYIINLQEFIDSSYDGIVISNVNGMIIYANKSFLKISELRPDDIIGKFSRNLIKSNILSRSVANIAIREKETSSGIIKYSSGKEAMVTSTPLYDEDNEMILIVSNVRDLTVLNTLHDELKKTKKLAKKFEKELNLIKTKTDDEFCKMHSKQMHQLEQLVLKIAKVDLEVLITGDTGIGKTALAKHIHSLSNRSKRKFLHINCSAIPESLLESELFGFEEGAFTGAKKAKSGLFEIANHGTVFLDEIGDLPISLQAKLLNVLHNKKFYRVGGTQEIKVDIRIIAATNANLEKKIADGSFREDLYYRLNVVPIRIPSLAERKEDLVPLINYYLEKINKKFNFNKQFSSEILGAMLKYDWPGNIRQLINFIERSVILSDSDVIEQKHLIYNNIDNDLVNLVKQDYDYNSRTINKQLWQPNTHLKDLLGLLENQIIEEALEKCATQKEAAQALGIDITTLFRKRNRNRKNVK